jgi:hypothetical protein
MRPVLARGVPRPLLAERGYASRPPLPGLRLFHGVALPVPDFAEPVTPTDASAGNISAAAVATEFSDPEPLIGVLLYGQVLPVARERILARRGGSGQLGETTVEDERRRFTSPRRPLTLPTVRRRRRWPAEEDARPRMGDYGTTVVAIGSTVFRSDLTAWMASGRAQAAREAMLSRLQIGRVSAPHDDAVTLPTSRARERQTVTGQILYVYGVIPRAEIAP